MLSLKRDSRAKRTLSKIERGAEAMFPYLKAVAVAMAFLGYVSILCAVGFVVVLGLYAGEWILSPFETVLFVLMILIGVVEYIELSLKV